ncbi:hypothetical protein BRD19_10255 [Halobacteriales archaeon SW_7_65_23]|nr:MAG: hypothetical protein BRD19_10255 [Halobacteriales archaeon SW_7_65_23]
MYLQGQLLDTAIKISASFNYSSPADIRRLVIAAIDPRIPGARHSDAGRQEAEHEQEGDSEDCQTTHRMGFASAMINLVRSTPRTASSSPGVFL